MKSLFARKQLAVAIGVGASALAFGVYAEDLGKIKVPTTRRSPRAPTCSGRPTTAAS